MINLDRLQGRRKFLTSCARTQDFHPRIHLTDSDYASVTASGTLCAEDGRLGAAEFEAAMRRQLLLYAQVSVWLATCKLDSAFIVDFMNFTLRRNKP